MESVKRILKSNSHINDIIVNNKISSYDINDNKAKNKYALDRTKFTPNTPESSLAEKIAAYFEDLSNFAFYFRVVKNLGEARTYSFWQSVKEEIEGKMGGRYEIRCPKKYFAWRYKRKIY